MQLLGQSTRRKKLHQVIGFLGLICATIFFIISAFLYKLPAQLHLQSLQLNRVASQNFQILKLGTQVQQAFELDHRIVQKRWPPWKSSCSKGQKHNPLGSFIQKQSTRVHKCCQGSTTSFSSARLTAADGKYWDARNVLIDFGRRDTSSHANAYGVKPGFLRLNCSMKAVGESGHNSFLRVAESANYTEMQLDADDIVEETVVLVQRDDCGNAFHALIIHVMVYEMLRVLKVSPSQVRIVIIDKAIVCQHPKTIDCVDPRQCPYVQAWDALGHLGLTPAIEWGSKRVLFRHVLMPLSNFNLIWGHGEYCHGPKLLSDYVSNVKQHLGIRENLASDTIRITLLDRKRKSSVDEVVGRRISNLQELENELSSLLLPPPTKVLVRSVSFTDISFTKQVQLMSDTDILVGMHGAGLTNLVYLPAHAHILELFPYTWHADEYYELAGLRRRRYTSWRNSHRLRHVDPACEPFVRGERWRAYGMHSCRGSRTDITNVTVSEVSLLVQRAIHEIISRRSRFLSPVEPL